MDKAQLYDVPMVMLAALSNAETKQREAARLWDEGKYAELDALAAKALPKSAAALTPRKVVEGLAALVEQHKTAVAATIAEAEATRIAAMKEAQ